MIVKHMHGICACVERDAILFDACEPRASSISKREEGLGISLFFVLFFSTGRKFFYIHKWYFKQPKVLSASFSD